jgi:hypothetical protein
VTSGKEQCCQSVLRGYAVCVVWVAMLTLMSFAMAPDSDDAYISHARPGCLGKPDMVG